ncbi:hypothetical protein BDR05DRAFT_989282 [Suillus weaverae]|nr:hypothetical protein BDR05DRAFT_989282 [Suillus weaverae]
MCQLGCSRGCDIEAQVGVPASQCFNLQTCFRVAASAAPQSNKGPPLHLKKSRVLFSLNKGGIKKGVRSSIFAIFRKKQTSQPDAKIRRESSVTGAILQEMEEETEKEAAWQGLLNRTEDRSSPPALVDHQVRQTTAIRRSRVIRRSASFAGLDSKIENRNGERGSVMEAVFQLRQVWNETTDVTPDFDERSDEEDY